MYSCDSHKRYSAFLAISLNSYNGAPLPGHRKIGLFNMFDVEGAHRSDVLGLIGLGQSRL